MKRMILTASAVVALSVLGAGCAKTATPAAEAAHKPGGTQKTCPVMGGDVNPHLFVDAAGKRIYVCCEGCISAIKENPAKYIAQLEKQGVVLDKTPAANPAGSKQQP